jgi:integrase
MPLPLLAEWLGHAQLETTQIYYGKQVIMESKDQNTLKL